MNNRVALVCDLLEERWPSMDLVADMTYSHLRSNPGSGFEVHQIRPAMVQRFEKWLPHNAQRFCNRFWDYPSYLNRIRSEFDVFHIMDHSYAQMVHHLPAKRTLLTCHDLDLFRCLVAPEQEPRPAWFRQMARHVLNGFRKAARVLCVSTVTRDEVISHRLVPEERVVVLANGKHPSCVPTANAVADRTAEELLGPKVPDTLELLHVGNTLPRKRIDLLLKVIAGVRKMRPQVRLIRVGGALTEELTQLARELRVLDSIRTLPFLERDVLAAVYRRASLVLQTSDREGFGLPVVEALGCGTPVVASDIPVLREVGGVSVSYCPVGDIDYWVRNVDELLEESVSEPHLWSRRQEAGIRHSDDFSWGAHARRLEDLYRDVLREESSLNKTKSKKHDICQN